MTTAVAVVKTCTVSNFKCMDLSISFVVQKFRWKVLTKRIEYCYGVKLNLISIVLPSSIALPTKHTWNLDNFRSEIPYLPPKLMYTRRHKKKTFRKSSRKQKSTKLNRKLYRTGIVELKTGFACCAFFNCEFRILSFKSEIIPV